ncbi:MAG TPA: hypothetical protein VGO47_05020 [Chlamydiales bacterium]|jgi:hypothetical protein|nr:hypothetical protein [Chlamydiales bacterium]
MSSKKFENLPKFHELPMFGGLRGCAWEVWGKGDQLGTVNLLTDEVVARAAREEVKYVSADSSSSSSVQTYSVCL